MVVPPLALHSHEASLRLPRSAAVAVATALALLTAWPALAATLSIGLKGGLTASNFSGDLPTDPFEPHTTKLGFGGGLAFGFDVGHGIAIQPELLFVMKGTSLGKVDITDNSGSTVGHARIALALDYIEVPLLARFSLPGNGRTSPYMVLGPTLGLRGAQRQKMHGDVNLSLPLNIAKETDVGAALGMGAEVGTGRGRFNIEGRYTLGLSAATESYFSDTARNGAMMILVGVAIHP